MADRVGYRSENLQDLGRPNRHLHHAKSSPSTPAANVKFSTDDGALDKEGLRAELKSFGDMFKESLCRDIGLMLRQLNDDLQTVVAVSRPRMSSGSSAPISRVARPSLPASAMSSLHSVFPFGNGNMFISEGSTYPIHPEGGGSQEMLMTSSASREAEVSPKSKSPLGGQISSHGMPGLLPPFSPSQSRLGSARPSTRSDHSMMTVGTLGTHLTATTVCTDASSSSRLRSRKGYVHRREKQLLKGRKQSVISLQINSPMKNQARRSTVNLASVAKFVVPNFTSLTPMERILSDRSDRERNSSNSTDAHTDPETQDVNAAPCPSAPSKDKAQNPADDQKALVPRRFSASSVTDSNGSTSKCAARKKGLGSSKTWNHRLSGESSKTQDFLNALPDVLKAQRSDTRLSRSQRCTRCTSLLVDWVESMQFDYMVGLLILLNAASIGAQTDFIARHKTDIVPAAFRVVEIIFCICFSMELCLRLYVYRISFFCSPGWKWNTFDATLVLLQIAEEAMNFIANLANDGSSDDMKDFAVMKIMRILRLVRIMRLVRVLRLVGELHTIVISICGSMKSLCWTIVLLLLLMYIVGVYFTQLISDHMIVLKASDEEPVETQLALTLYFGSLGDAMLTLFQAITGGVSWRDVLQPMIDHISPWVSLVFGLYIAFCIFALMNIVTGVFVENALETARKDKDMMLLQQVRSLFSATDVDGSGQISWEEFEDQLENPDMQLIFEAIDLDIEEAKELFHLLDGDASGEVDCEEFVNGCFRLRGPAKAIDLATMMSDFDKMMKNYQTHSRQVEGALRWLSSQQTKPDANLGNAPVNLSDDKRPSLPLGTSSQNLASAANAAVDPKELT